MQRIAQGIIFIGLIASSLGFECWDLYANNQFPNCTEYMSARMCPMDGSVVYENNATDIYIGVIGPYSWAFSWSGSAYMGMSCALEEIKAENKILQGVNIHPVFADSGGHQLGGFRAGMCLYNAGIKIILGPYISESATGMGVVGNLYNIPFLSLTPSSQVLENRDPKSGYPTLSRIIYSSTSQADALIHLMNQFEWKYINIIHERGNSYAEGIAERAKEVAKELGKTVLNSFSFSFSSTDASIDDVLDRIRESGVRITLISSYGSMARKYLARAKLKNMIGKGWIYLSPDRWSGVYADGAGIGQIGIKPKSYTDSENPARARLQTCLNSHAEDTSGPFKKYPYMYTNLSPSTGTTFSYDGMLMLAKVIDKMGYSGINHDWAGTLATIRNTTVEGSTGDIALRSDGELLSGKFDYVNLVAEGKYVAIGDFDRSNSKITMRDVDIMFGVNGDSVVPKDVVLQCTVQEGHYNVTTSDICTEKGRLVLFQRVGTIAIDACPEAEDYFVPCDFPSTFNGGATAVFALSIVSTLVMSLFLAYLLRHWNHKIVRRGQRTFLLLLVVGAIICQIPILVNFNNRGTDFSCALVPTCTSIGGALMFSTILLKVWRIHALLNSPTLKKVVLKDSNLMVRLVLIVSTIIGLNALLLLFTTPRLIETYYFDLEHQTRITIHQCSIPDSSITNVIYFAFTVLMAAGCYWSFKTRMIPGDIAESKWIFIATYNCLLCSLVGIGVTTTLQLDAVGVYVIGNLCIIVASLGIVVLVLLPKFYLIFFGIDVQFSVQHPKGSTTHGAVTSTGNKGHSNKYSNGSLRISNRDTLSAKVAPQ